MLAGSVHAHLPGSKWCCGRRRLAAASFRRQRPQRPCRTARASLSEDMEQIQREIHDKEAVMHQHAQQEEYKAAAAERDSIQLLQVRRRHLEFELEKEKHESVRHTIGSVIRHRRYAYKGVIVGYDTSCLAPEAWMRAMNIDALPLGRNQPFYHVLVDEQDRPRGSSTYVAQENINPLPPSAATPVNNELVPHNFYDFSGGRYKPKPHIVEQYPHARYEEGSKDSESSSDAAD